MMSELKNTAAAEEVAVGERFAFGANWRRFLRGLDDEKITRARQSMLDFIGHERAHELRDARFVDVGSGSGLSSLVAYQLGARVYSFDYDDESVACTHTLQNRYRNPAGDWQVAQGSVLDTDFLTGLGQYDWVYSWGVLHHTGQMWQALSNVVGLVAERGYAFIAIYNDQGWISTYWRAVKKIYNSGRFGRWLMIAVHLPYLFVLRWCVRALSGRLNYERGMSLWWDMLDWLGGYPFEVATPAQIQQFFAERGFEMLNSKTCGRRQGCNEFLFKRLPAPQ